MSLMMPGFGSIASPCRRNISICFLISSFPNPSREICSITSSIWALPLSSAIPRITSLILRMRSLLPFENPVTTLSMSNDPDFASYATWRRQVSTMLMTRSASDLFNVL